MLPPAANSSRSPATTLNRKLGKSGRNTLRNTAKNHKIAEILFFWRGDVGGFYVKASFLLYCAAHAGLLGGDAGDDLSVRTPFLLLCLLSN